MSLIRFSVRQVVLVNLSFVVLMLAGLLVSNRIPVDVFPDISFNSAILVTPWPGASADEVERLVTRKIEDEVRDIAGIKEWYSFSSEGLSEINIEWEETLSKFEQQAALNELRAAIDRVADLPARCGRKHPPRALGFRGLQRLHDHLDRCGERRGIHLA